MHGITAMRCAQQRLSSNSARFERLSGVADSTVGALPLTAPPRVRGFFRSHAGSGIRDRRLSP